MTVYASIQSSLGQLFLTSQENQLTGLYFSDQSHVPRIKYFWVEQENAEIFAQTREQLEEYASGNRERFDLALNLLGTSFQMRVWNAIAAIPFGETITYTELAQRVGSAQAIRAAASATGRNPISWIVPCHRVVGKGGSLTGYAGGMERKKALLEFEAGKSAELVFGKQEHELALA